MYWGTSSTTNGIIMVESSAIKHSFLPGKFSFANENAAIVEEIVPKNSTPAETITLFLIPVTRFDLVHTST